MDLCKQSNTKTREDDTSCYIHEPRSRASTEKLSGMTPRLIFRIRTKFIDTLTLFMPYPNYTVSSLC